MEQDGVEAYFWNNAHSNLTSTFRYWAKEACRIGIARPVYVPAEFAHPKGLFIRSIVERTERLQGLLVARYGQRNPILCSHCISSYTTTRTSAHEHILSPFHECISWTSAPDAACANCLWKGLASSCEWREFPAYRFGSQDIQSSQFALLGRNGSTTTGTFTADIELPNPRDCPRLTRAWPFDEAQAGKEVWAKLNPNQPRRNAKRTARK